MDGSWPYASNSSAKPLCLFPALGLYNPTNNNKRKRNFNMLDESWPCMLTSLIKPFRPFSALDLYNLTNNNKCKRNFDIAFLTSRLLADNHDQEKIDLSFAGCSCPDTGTLNRSWQLDLLDLMPICIIEVIPLVAALFWNSIFMPCPCNTIKLAFKLGLRMKRIKSVTTMRELRLYGPIKPSINWIDCLGIIKSGSLEL